MVAALSSRNSRGSFLTLAGSYLYGAGSRDTPRVTGQASSARAGVRATKSEARQSRVRDMRGLRGAGERFSHCGWRGGEPQGRRREDARQGESEQAALWSAETEFPL